LHPEILRGLDERGADLYRINLSHTALDQIEPTIALIRSVSSTPICLDTEGPQARCGPVVEELVLQEGDQVRLTSSPVLGDRKRLSIRPPAALGFVRVGSTIGIDFDGARLRVEELGEGWATATVVHGGRVRSNRAVAMDPPPALPALSDKDRQAIQIGARLGITHYALSFASGAADVDLIRSLAPAGAHIMAKIESRLGVRNMDGVIEATDSVIIDRGDLSHEIPIEHIPYYQKAIVRRANRGSRPVYVATNLLESLVTSTTPTIAEANDVANTLMDGVHGLVLAAETAIGMDPLGSFDLVLRAIEAFERASEGQLPLEDRPSQGARGWIG
jgi:pyruvate kinase